LAVPGAGATGGAARHRAPAALLRAEALLAAPSRASPAWRAFCSGAASRDRRSLEAELRLKAAQGTVEGTRAEDAYAMAFTCCVCGTRTAKRISKRAYHHGVVIVQCPGCGNRHLIADHFQWFTDAPTDIEQIMREKGEEVVRLNQYRLPDGPASTVVHIEGLELEGIPNAGADSDLGPPLMPAPELPDAESILEVVNSSEAASHGHEGPPAGELGK